nr:MAG TPA: hypothetical protein [Caudoviricetes sp.]
MLILGERKLHLAECINKWLQKVTNRITSGGGKSVGHANIFYYLHLPKRAECC